jgi:type VI secretion system secreted protein VgrG
MVHQSSAFPYSLQSIIDETRIRYTTDANFSDSRTDGSEGFYLTEIEAQRTSVPYHSPFEHQKPETHLESAIVVGPEGEEVYTDELNRIKVQYIWDRLHGGDEKSSCWVRVAQSDTGSGYGSVHMPRVGEEVLIAHIGGDCDRPVVTSRLYNNSARPQWHSNGLLSGYRSKEYRGNGFNQLVMDDSTLQNRVQLYSSSFRSQLHLGYLVEHSGNSRGAFLGNGFDLKSDSYGAIRAGQGLFISTHSAAINQPLNITAAAEQLTSAKNVVELASQSSASNQAESLDEGLCALKKFTDATQYNVTGGTTTGGRTDGGGTGNANGFATPIMLIASPAGVSVSTQDSAQFTANQQVTIVSGKNTHVAAGKSLIASVMEKISLFAQNAGVKLFAANSSGKLILSAEKEIWIGAGGSYIRITADTIENGTSGQILEKCASWDKLGPSSMRLPSPVTSVTKGCSWKMAAASADSASSVILE